MLRLSLAQMRRSAGRLVAAGIAIAIGTAFVAAALFGGSVIKSTTARALTSSIGGADLVVSGWDADVELAEKIEKIDGIEAVYAQVATFEEINFKGRSEYTIVNTPAPNEQLEVITIGSGEMPTGENEIALSPGTMERLGISIGDEVSATVYSYDEQEDDSGLPDQSELKLTVTGSTEDPGGAYLSYGGGALTSVETQTKFLGGERSGYSADNITVALASGASVDDVKTQIETVD